VNRATRDRFVIGTNQADLTTGQACLQTPPDIFADLNDRFGPFAIDICADERTHLCPIWFGPDSPVGECDALRADWRAYAKGGKMFDNPPYGAFAARILEKAAAEAKKGQGSVHLLPMRATKAFHRYVLGRAATVLFCDKRIAFFENGRPRLNAKTGHPDAALFDSIVVIFQPRRKGKRVFTRMGTYHVPEHVKRYL
jgi:phage N-6-adenine-methyltransferase